MRFVLSTNSSYNAIWFLRHKFYTYLNIALLSAAVFNQLRSLTYFYKGVRHTKVKVLFDIAIA